eukprot:gene2469-2508_t
MQLVSGAKCLLDWQLQVTAFIRVWSKTMIKTVKAFLNNESGATAIEYGLIASLIGVAIIGSLTATGSKLKNTFSNLQRPRISGAVLRFIVKCLIEAAEARFNIAANRFAPAAYLLRKPNSFTNISLFLGKLMPVSMLSLLTLLIFPFLMAYAGASDLFTMTISNRISTALVVSFVLFALLAGFPLVDIGLHLSCGLAILVMTFTFFAFGWIGGGDAKLAAGTAVWLGWGNIMDYGVMTSILGGIVTLAFIQVRKAPLPQWAAAREWIARLYNADNGVPYGLALAASGLIIFPDTEIWHAAISY